jgi:hypothetical protein
MGGAGAGKTMGLGLDHGAEVIAAEGALLLQVDPDVV